MKIMSDFTKTTRFRNLKSRETMKTKESLFNYIELLEQQVQSLNKRLRLVEDYVDRRVADIAIENSNLDKKLAEQSEERSGDGQEEQWWELDPIPTIEDA